MGRSAPCPPGRACSCRAWSKDSDRSSAATSGGRVRCPASSRSTSSSTGMPRRDGSPTTWPMQTSNRTGPPRPDWPFRQRRVSSRNLPSSWLDPWRSLPRLLPERPFKQVLVDLGSSETSRSASSSSERLRTYATSARLVSSPALLLLMSPSLKPPMRHDAWTVWWSTHRPGSVGRFGDRGLPWTSCSQASYYNIAGSPPSLIPSTAKHAERREPMSAERP